MIMKIVKASMALEAIDHEFAMAGFSKGGSKTPSRCACRCC